MFMSALLIPQPPPAPRVLLAVIIAGVGWLLITTAIRLLAGLARLAVSAGIVAGAAGLWWWLT